MMRLSVASVRDLYMRVWTLKRGTGLLPSTIVMWVLVGLFVLNTVLPHQPRHAVPPAA